MPVIKISVKVLNLDFNMRGMKEGGGGCGGEGYQHQYVHGFPGQKYGHHIIM